MFVVYTWTQRGLTTAMNSIIEWQKFIYPKSYNAKKPRGVILAGPGVNIIKLGGFTADLKR